MDWIFIISLGTGIIYAGTILLFLVGWFRRPAFILSDHIPSVKISVIIPVRNEEENIETLLINLLGQNFPSEHFELIVVNDHSTDSTAMILARYQKRYCNLRVISLDNSSLRGKKAALEKGIEHAKYELFAVTDGDCKVHRNWLLAIAQYYEQYKPVMILGPVIFEGQNSVWQRIAKLEHFSLLGISAGSCGMKMPVMASGANMTCEKKLFYELNNPLMKQTPSGDDMFLLLKAKIFHRNRIHFIKHTDAAIYTKPPASLGSFMEQRKRWVSKTRYYSDHEVLITGGVVFFTSFLLFLLIPAVFIRPGVLKSFFALFLLKSFTDFLLLLSVTSYFKNKHLMYYFLPAQMLYFAYVTISGFAGFFSSYYWKGRKWSG